MTQSGCNYAAAPDSNYGELTNFEPSDFLKFDEWTEEEEEEKSFLLCVSPNNHPVYQAHVMGESGGATGSHGGPSVGGEQKVVN